MPKPDSSQPENELPRLGSVDGWFTPWRFGLFLAVILGATFPKVLLGWETFYYSDFANFGYPLAHFFRESFWRGEVPLWNPYSNCGIPFLAQWNTQTLYPFNLFYLLFPLSWSLGVFCLLHLFWAGLGMYFLAFHRTGNRLAAALAGTVYAFNGLIWFSIMWPHYVASLAWMPWVILAVDLAWRQGGKKILLAGIVGALQMLSGTPEIIVLTWVAIGVFGFTRFLAEPASWFRLLGRSLLLIGLISALAAAQLLPFLDLLAHSQRNPSYGTTTWSLPVTGLANYLLPAFHLSRMSISDLPFQNHQAYFSSYYVGVGTIALVLVAVWRFRQREVWALLILALASLALAMGNDGIIYSWLRQTIPQIGFMRYPVKFIMLTTFVLPLMAAYAVAGFQTSTGSERKSGQINLLVIAGALLACLAGLTWQAWKHPAPADEVSRTLINAGTRAIFLLLIPGCFGLLRHLTERRDQILLSVWILLLFWLDVFTHLTPLAPTISRQLYQPGEFQLELAQTAPELKLGQARVWSTGNGVRPTSLSGKMDDFTQRQAVSFQNFNLMDDVPKVDGFFALYLKEMGLVYFNLNQSGTNSSPLQNFIGISRMSNFEGPYGWPHRDNYLPMLSAGQEPIFLDEAETLQKIISPDFKPDRFVYLPASAQPQVNAFRARGTKIISSQITAQKITATIEGTAPAMLVIAQAYYHNWQAFVDGQPTPLWRANYAFQALEVPAGNHQIQIIYEDKRFSCGGLHFPFYFDRLPGRIYLET